MNEHRSRFLICKAHDVPVQEILREAVGCRPMYFEGGGVTFTGGEPTQQWEALGFLLRGLQAEHIHTAIETNGTHPHLEELFGAIDHLIKMCIRDRVCAHESALQNGEAVMVPEF